VFLEKLTEMSLGNFCAVFYNTNIIFAYMQDVARRRRGIYERRTRDTDKTDKSVM
jgi:hypothetical protein